MANHVKQKTIALAMSKITVYILASLVITAALFFAYFTQVFVVTLTVLEKTNKQMQSLSLEVSEMESKRLLIENSINKETAKTLGFVEANNPTFIMRNTQKATLSLKID